MTCLPAILGLSGPTLTAAERERLRRAPPFGLCLFGRNIVSPGQLAALVSEIRSAAPGLRLMVDQEGGRVARLRPPHWRAHPPAARLGALAARDPEAGERAAFLTGALIGAQCRAAGFDIVAAPVLDLACEGADPVIGDRAFAASAARVARLGGAVADGLRAAGVQPIGKHAPGHGAADADSHVSLPRVASTDPAALVPFRALAPRLGWMMTAHVVYEAQDRSEPATLSATLIERTIRGEIGFEGVLVSDDLAMGALTGDPLTRARACLAAGCDLALECSGIGAANDALLAGLDAMGEASRRRIEAADALLRQGARALDEPERLAEERDRLLGA